LIYDGLVIRETCTSSKPKRFRQIDNEQHNSDTQIPAQATLEFYIIINSV